jgi:hypothetical protein
MAWLALAIVSLVVGLHQFRFFGATARYGGGQTPPAALFTKTEMEALAAFLGRDKVEVEVNNPHPALLCSFTLAGESAQGERLDKPPARGYAKPHGRKTVSDETVLRRNLRERRTIQKRAQDASVEQKSCTSERGAECETPRTKAADRLTWAPKP